MLASSTIDTIRKHSVGGSGPISRLLALPSGTWLTRASSPPLQGQSPGLPFATPALASCLHDRSWASRPLHTAALRLKLLAVVPHLQLAARTLLQPTAIPAIAMATGLHQAAGCGPALACRPHARCSRHAAPQPVRAHRLRWVGAAGRPPCSRCCPRPTCALRERLWECLRPSCRAPPLLGPGTHLRRRCRDRGPCRCRAAVGEAARTGAHEQAAALEAARQAAELSLETYQYIKAGEQQAQVGWGEQGRRWQGRQL